MSETLEQLWPDATLRERNLDIVAAKHRGLSYREIARTFSLSMDHCKVILREWRSINPTIRNQSSMEILDEVLEMHQAAIAELAMVSHTTKYDAVRVGAIKARLEAMRTVVEILQATGNLPQDLGTLRVQIDQRVVAARFMAVFDAMGVSDEIADALLKALEDSTPDPATLGELGIGKG